MNSGGLNLVRKHIEAEPARCTLASHLKAEGTRLLPYDRARRKAPAGTISGGGVPLFQSGGGN